MRPVTIVTWRPASRAASRAAIVRGRSSPSSAISVRSRSHASASTWLGKSSGSRMGYVPATEETYAATSAICFSES